MSGDFFMIETKGLKNVQFLRAKKIPYEDVSLAPSWNLLPLRNLYNNKKHNHNNQLNIYLEPITLLLW